MKIDVSPTGCIGNVGCLAVVLGAGITIQTCVHGVMLLSNGSGAPIRFLKNLFSKGIPNTTTPLSLLKDLCIDLNALFPFFLILFLVLFSKSKKNPSYKRAVKVVGIATVIVFVAALIVVVPDLVGVFM